MPYKSKAQQRFMHVHHPRIARRWDAHTSRSQFKRLPARKGRGRSRKTK
jgi:hypothetical protein